MAQLNQFYLAGVQAARETFNTKTAGLGGGLGGLLGGPLGAGVGARIQDPGSGKAAFGNALLGSIPGLIALLYGRPSGVPLMHLGSALGGHIGQNRGRSIGQKLKHKLS